MSATITSSLVKSTTTYSYGWSDPTAPNASPSVERINGVEKRRNDFIDPLFTLARNWTPTAGATYDYSVPNYVQVTATATLSVGALIIFPAAALTASPGDFRAARYVVDNLSDAPVIMYGNIRAYGASGATGDGETSEPVTIAPGRSASINIPALAMPAGTTGYRPLLRTRGFAAGQTVALSKPFTQATNGTPGAYFDATTLGRTVRTYETTEPTLVLGYESSRPASTIVHQRLGGATDVLVRPAGLRTGTLRLFYYLEYDAAAAEDMLAKAASFTLNETDRYTINMEFVLSGTLTRYLDDQTRDRWVVEVGYQEVTRS